MRVQEIADTPAAPDERISLGHVIEGFGNHAFGALLVIFAVPVALPIAIPGISAVRVPPPRGVGPSPRSPGSEEPDRRTQNP